MEEGMMSRERAALKEIQRIVDKQSNDEELWKGKEFKKALFELHDTIERFTIPLFENCTLAYPIPAEDTLKVADVNL